MRLAHEVAGEGPPLVLLHGFTGSRESWRPHLPALAARFRTIAVDLPGHGCSPPAGASEGPAALAAELVALAARLGAPRAHWLGYSLGGRMALHVAVLHPAAVDRLVLESASPGIEDAGERAARRAADDALADDIERDGLEPFVDRWMALPLFRSQARLGPDGLARERARRLGCSAAGLAASLRTLGTGLQDSLWPRLATLRAPVTLVVGEDDAKFRAIAERMAARLPAARVAVVAAAGHTTHLENPDGFVTAALDALGADRHHPRRRTA